jgi:hypothetical protein
MVDLPQHAAQAATWLRMADPAHPYHDLLEVDWRTPSVLMSTVARALSEFMPVRIVMKTLVSVAVVGLPLSVLRLLRHCGGQHWWALLAFPVAYSFAFFWGFLAFILAVPLSLVLLVEVDRFSRVPSLRRGMLVGGLVLLLASCNVLVFGFAVGVGVLWTVARAPGLRAAFVRMLPLLAPLVPVLVWVLWTRRTEMGAGVPIEWRLTPRRPVDGLSTMLSIDSEMATALFGLALLCLPFVFGARFSRSWGRRTPLLVVLTVVLLGPYQVLGCAFIHSRYSVYLLPFLFFALERGPQQRSNAGRLVATAITCAWLLLMAQRFVGFNQEAAGFDLLVEEMRPGSRVLSLPFEPRSAFTPGSPFLHFPSWYQVDHGGLVDFSFHSFYVLMVRYRPETNPPPSFGFGWQPSKFDWEHHRGDLYDYFVVRSPLDLTEHLFKEADVPIQFVMKSGWWYLYAADRSATATGDGDERGALLGPAGQTEALLGSK